MKTLATLFSVLIIFAVNGQKPEELIPQEAISVFSLNNINLLQKISLDELVQYEFMEEIQQEIFDGSTAQKTIKESGIDFNQKLNIFIGRTANYDVTGLTFGIENRKEFFTVFDDFKSAKSPYPEVDIYTSYFNRIAISGNSGILFRVIPKDFRVTAITDSIWEALGHTPEWYNEESFTEYEVEVISEELTIEEAFEEAEHNPSEKTYLELRDSVDLSMQEKTVKAICDDLFIHKNMLINQSPEFKNQLKSATEGTFYMDNSKGFQNENTFDFMRSVHPQIYTQFEKLYTGNLMLGSIHILDHEIQFKLDAQYGEKIGAVYEELTDAKFDKNILPYIHQNNQAFFTYNLNLRNAYEKVTEILLPILSESKSREIAALVLVIELMDEYLNKDALFASYKGSLFGTFNGIQKIKTKKFIWEYDEENYDYTEQEVEAEEDMPIFVIGFSTDRNDIMDKIMKFNSQFYSETHDMGEYYMIDNAILNTAPLYIINKNNLFIYTNDENLAKTHSNGYGDASITKKKIKKAMKGGAVYAHVDLSKAVEELPEELFNTQQNQIVNVLRGKSGVFELTSSKTSNTVTSFSMNYKFEGEYTNSGTYLLDLINSLYVISK